MQNELGITVSVGVSFCKFLSKLSSDINKPNGIFRQTAAIIKKSSIRAL